MESRPSALDRALARLCRALQRAPRELRRESLLRLTPRVQAALLVHMESQKLSQGLELESKVGASLLYHPITVKHNITTYGENQSQFVNKTTAFFKPSPKNWDDFVNDKELHGLIEELLAHLVHSLVWGARHLAMAQPQTFCT